MVDEDVAQPSGPDLVGRATSLRVTFRCLVDQSEHTKIGFEVAVGGRVVDHEDTLGTEPHQCLGDPCHRRTRDPGDELGEEQGPRRAGGECVDHRPLRVLAMLTDGCARSHVLMSPAPAPCVKRLLLMGCMHIVHVRDGRVRRTGWSRDPRPCRGALRRRRHFCRRRGRRARCRRAGPSRAASPAGPRQFRLRPAGPSPWATSSAATPAASSAATMRPKCAVWRADGARACRDGSTCESRLIPQRLSTACPVDAGTSTIAHA